MKEVIAMRKSFRGAVTLASLLVLVGPATLLAQYPVIQPIVQQTPIYQPPNYQPYQQPAVIQQPPVAQPQQTIAQPTQPPSQAPQPQAKQAPAPAPAKPAADDAITKAWLDKVIADRLKEAIAKQAEQAKVESEKVQATEQPAKPKVVEQSTRTMPAPPNVLALRYLADNSSFESSIEESKVEYQTNGIDLSKVPTTVRITHGGEDLTVQQFGDELKAHYGAGDKFTEDKAKYWVGIFGPREFEEQVKRLLATDPSWQIIAEKCIVDFKSAAGNEKLAWRWKSIDCDKPQGILVCAPGYDRSSPDDACQAVHAQTDLDSFVEVIGSPPTVQDTTSTDGAASKYEGPNRRKRDSDSPLPFSRVKDARNAMRLISWAWYALWASPGLLFLLLLFYAPVQTMRFVSAVFGWLVPSWMKRSKVEVPTTPIVVPTNPVVPEPSPAPTPTVDEMDQVDRSQDARLNRLEEMIVKLASQQPVKVEFTTKRASRTTRKPAKR